MPKTNDPGGATYFGYEGVVEHAGGRGSTRPGGLSELDPNLNVDGTVVDGFESEDRDLKGEEREDVRPDPRGVAPAGSGQEQEQESDESLARRESDDAGAGTSEGGGSSSDGSSSVRSARSSGSSGAKTQKNGR